MESQVVILIFVSGLFLIGLYFWMIFVRPFQMMHLARKYKLPYRWLHLRKINWLIYELRKNIIGHKADGLLIYDTTYSGIHSLRLIRRRTVVITNRKIYELRDFLLGYANPAKIEKIIKSKVVSN